MSLISPYLNFDGNAREAFEFYRSVFGGEFMNLSPMGEAPGGDQLPPEEQKRLMHVSLPIGSQGFLMGSDIFPSMGHTLREGNQMHLMYAPESEEDARRVFNALAEGGQVSMPLEATFWNAIYGALTDKFGVSWMINYDLAQEG